MRRLDQLTAASLTSTRLILEPQAPRHASELAPVLDDIALHRFTGGEPLDPEQLRARLERQSRGGSPDGCERWLNWTARVRSTGRAVGTMQATVSDERPGRVAVLAWVIGTSHQGAGLATEATTLMASWLGEQGVLRLRAHIHPEHAASMAVARAIGLSPTKVTVNGERRWER